MDVTLTSHSKLVNAADNMFPAITPAYRSMLFMFSANQPRDRSATTLSPPRGFNVVVEKLNAGSDWHHCNITGATEKTVWLTDLKNTANSGSYIREANYGHNNTPAGTDHVQSPPDVECL